MGKMNAPLLALNRGEVSRLALVRVDIERLRLTSECQVNWLPSVLGNMMLRPGLQLVAEIYNDQPALGIPFIFSKFDTASIELTPGFMRVLVNETPIKRVAVSTIVGDPTFNGFGSWDTSGTTAGCTTTVAGGFLRLSALAVGGLAQAKQQITVAVGDRGKEQAIRITVSNGPVTVRAGSTDGSSDLIAQTALDTGTHSLACTPSSNIFLQIESTDAWEKSLTQCTIEAAGDMLLPTPWGSGDLSTIRVDQSGDVIYIATYGKQQYKIERRSTNGWSIAKYRSNNGPFQTSPGIKANLTPGNYYGNTTLSSDRAYFQPEHIGALFQLFTNGQVNAALLGNQNAATKSVRVTGVGTLARNYNWTIAGTYVGQLTLQRSFDGPNAGFTDVSTSASGFTGTVASSTGGSGGTPPLDNVIAWERLIFKAGAYTSGSANVSSNYSGGGSYGLCRVTDYVSPTQVLIEILSPFSSLQATDSWLESDWSDLIGWPTSVTFFEGRLFWFGRDKTWGSQSDNYVGFATQDLTGASLGDSGAIIQAFGSGPVDSINWGLSLTRLLAGREGSIYSIRSSSFDQVLTPTNISAKACSPQGAARLPAIKLGKNGIFVQESGARVYELELPAQAFDYTDHDLTRLNPDIGAFGFVSISSQVQPDKMVHLPRGDGQVALLLYDPEDEVEAWWRIMTLGIIERSWSLPAATGPEDIAYYIVKRVINGVTRRFIEKLAPRSQCKGGNLCRLADCHIAFDGAPTSTVSVPHLIGQQVIIWADGQDRGTATVDGAGNVALGGSYSKIVVGLGGGSVSYSGSEINVMTGIPAIYEGLPGEVFCGPQHIGSVTVSGGTITLPNNLLATDITVFFGFVAPFQSAKLAYAGEKGTAIEQKKKIDRLGLLLSDTHAQGIRYGQRIDKLDDMPLIEDGVTVTTGKIWGDYDEPMIAIPGEWNTDARLCLLAQAPRPARVGGVVVAVDTEDL